MGRILLAFRSFFGILFQGALPAEAAKALGLSKTVAAPSPPNLRRITSTARLVSWEFFSAMRGWWIF